MKTLLMVMVWLMNLSQAQADDPQTSVFSTESIQQFEWVTSHIASSAAPDLNQYADLKAAGIEHIIVLSTGLHLVERTHAEALGLTYTQLRVSLDQPQDQMFNRFVELMTEMDHQVVLVYSEQNWRAATYVYRYQNHLTARQMVATP